MWRWVYACMVRVLLYCILNLAYYEMDFSKAVCRRIVQSYGFRRVSSQCRLSVCLFSCFCTFISVSHGESQAILLFFNRSTRVVLRYFSNGLPYISFRSADFYGIEAKQWNHTTPRAERYLLCANLSIFTLSHARTRTHTSTWTVHNSESLARSFCDSLRVPAPYSERIHPLRHRSCHGLPCTRNWNTPNIDVGTANSANNKWRLPRNCFTRPSTRDSA